MKTTYEIERGPDGRERTCQSPNAKHAWGTESLITATQVSIVRVSVCIRCGMVRVQRWSGKESPQ